MTTTTRAADAASPRATAPRSGTGVDPTIAFRRWASALAFPLAFLGQLGGCLGYAIATTNGGDDSTGAHALALYSKNSGLVQFATLASIIGCFLFVPGIIAALRVLRTSKPRLSLAAGILVIVGYLCYAVVLGSNFATVTLGEGHVDAAAALDAAQQLPAAIPLFPVFILGNLGGLALLAVAVFLSRGAVGGRPTWIAGVGILAWPMLHITGLIVGSEWFEVVGASLAAIGAALVAVAAIRLGDSAWSRRG